MRSISNIGKNCPYTNGRPVKIRRGLAAVIFRRAHKKPLQTIFAGRCAPIGRQKSPIRNEPEDVCMRIVHSILE